jgi:hypothetical protein
MPPLTELGRGGQGRVLFEGHSTRDGGLIRIECHGPDDYRILTSEPAAPGVFTPLERRSTWSSARAFVTRHTGGYACPDLAEPNGESLAAWRARTGEHGGLA